MRVRVIAVPYHLGEENVGMGRGPDRWLEAGLPEALRADGHEVEITLVGRAGSASDPLAATEEVNRGVVSAVREAAAAGELPLVLAGNCNSALGTLGGLGSGVSGVVWFDAHGDFNTPETSPSGFFDGMPISILTGACHRPLWDRLAGREPLPESHVVLAGIRDLDPGERRRLEESDLLAVRADAIRTDGIDVALGPALDQLAARSDTLYLHIDIDTLDPSVARCNTYQAPDGLWLEDLERAIEMIRARFDVRAAALTAFDPEVDADGRAARAGIELARRMLA